MPSLPSVGLSMIVRNAEKDLRACLASASPVVSQIVIADTGSTDRTREVAAEFGALLVSFPWKDHFADARNAALEPVTMDWVLVLDADEELAPGAADAIPILLRNPGRTGGYQVTIRNYFPYRFCQSFEQLSRVNLDEIGARKALCHTEHKMTRLFRRHPDVLFEGRVHEQVDPRIRKAGYEIGAANFKIRHFGPLNTDASQRKRSCYLELGRRKVEEQPSGALAWFELGCEYFQAERFDEALDCMMRSEALHPWALAALYIARIHVARQRPVDALAALARIPQEGDIGLLSSEIGGDILHDVGSIAESRAAYQTALRLSPGKSRREPCGREPLIESKLGYTEVRLGLVRMGLARLRRAVAQMPDLIDNHDRLVKALVLLGRNAEAADAAEQILHDFYSEKIYRRAAALRMRAGQPTRAMELVEAGLGLFPGSRELAQMREAMGRKAAPEATVSRVAADSARAESRCGEG